MKPYILKDTAIELSVDMNASHDGSVIDCRDFGRLLITAQWINADATDGSFSIEISNNGTGNWETFHGTSFGVTTGYGAHHWDWDKRAIPFIRVKWNHGTNTTGIYSVTCWMEA